jgi:hypothetical protein
MGGNVFGRQGPEVQILSLRPSFPPFNSRTTERVYAKLSPTYLQKAVRALAWLGPEKAEAALAALKRKMPPGMFGELVAAAPQLPTWLAQSVGRVAYEPREMTK